MGFYEPKQGERVRVVLEGEVLRGRASKGFTVGFNYINQNDSHVMSVEKVEPPVVTFKPGDTVRHRFNGLVYTLAEAGYLFHGFAHGGGTEWRGYDRIEWAVAPDTAFTTKTFELVELK